MDITIGICVPLLIVCGMCSGTLSQLYLQPSKSEHGYFTNDSFFITCFTTDETIDQLTWSDFDGKEITASEGRIHVQNADGIQQGLRLVFSNVQKQDAGSYTCSDIHDSVSFDLIVHRSISFSDTQRMQHSPEGQTATVMCNVKADPVPVVYWYFNGSKLANDEKYRITEDHNLVVHNLSRNDAGDYKCKAYVITSLTSQVNEIDITLHVQYSPEILPEQKTVLYASFGRTTNLSCYVAADPPPMFQWIRDEDTLHNSSDHMILHYDNHSVLQMFVEDSYQLGEYICRASNTLGWKEIPIELKEGEVPLPPEMSIANEDRGKVKLNLKVKESGKQDDDLRVTGFRVEHILAGEAWDVATAQDFDMDDTYLLRNMSYSSEYVLRAQARNAAGLSEYSDEIRYKTHSLQVASVISNNNGAYSMLASSSMLILSIVIFRMF